MKSATESRPSHNTTLFCHQELIAAPKKLHKVLFTRQAHCQSNVMYSIIHLNKFSHIVWNRQHEDISNTTVNCVHLIIIHNSHKRKCLPSNS